VAAARNATCGPPRCYDVVVGAGVDGCGTCRTVRASRAAATVTSAISIRFPLGSVTRLTRTGSRGFASPAYAGFALSLMRDEKLVDTQSPLRPTMVSNSFYWSNQPNATALWSGDSRRSA